MKEAQVILGTCSWSGDGWVGSFYPSGTKPADFLPYYARNFSSVEVDSTFYRIPSARTVEQWKNRTPEGFIFAAKIPRSITHEKVLLDAEDDLQRFLSVMDALGNKLGPLLFQFPYFNRQKFRVAASFLERLEPWLAKLPGGYQWVVEVRNKGWLTEELYAVLRRHGVALALLDHPWMPRPRELFEKGDPVTAGITYIRWLGDRKGIEELTKVWNKTIVDRTEDLRDWITLLPKLQSRAVRIFAFANNHYGGFAPHTIQAFLRLWGREQPPHWTKEGPGPS